MKICFLGSKGIPAKYGGLETFVEEISLRLIKKKYQVYVVCQSDRFKEDTYKGINRVHIPQLFKSYLTIPVIGDIISTLYMLCYHLHDIDVYFYSNIGGAIPAILLRLLGKEVIINSDGVEWRRMKRRITFVPWYQKPLYFITGNLLFFLEAITCKFSTITIADSEAIKSYLENTHHAKHVVHIAYGARTLESKRSVQEEKKVLQRFGINSYRYYLTVSRIVAENNIDMEINGFRQSQSKKKLVLIGNYFHKDAYTKYLKKLKKDNDNVLLLDPVYDQEILGILRKHCFAYIHAYEVGGTNPSLLEQMMFDRPILVYDVSFNHEVVNDGGIFFTDAHSLSSSIDELESKKFNKKEKIKKFKKRIEKKYNWENVTKQYDKMFQSLIQN